MLSVLAVESAVAQSSCSANLREAYGSVNVFWLFLTRIIKNIGMSATDSSQRNKACSAKKAGLIHPRKQGRGGPKSKGRALADAPPEPISDPEFRVV
jgi:hypothetical protein